MQPLIFPEIRFWSEYWAGQVDSAVGNQPFSVFAFENVSDPSRQSFTFAATETSTLWGFQASGHASIRGREQNWNVRAGQWFCIVDESLSVDLEPAGRLVAIQQRGYRGLNAVGGPVERFGRLRYIDGCTDTLLCAPPLSGEPCLNLLHFPAHVNQAFHHHPSFRAGMIYSGHGVCDCDGKSFVLEAGSVFYLPPLVRHRFRTSIQSMIVIAFHPDSDWGPTHEVHPMINRTLRDVEI